MTIQEIRKHFPLESSNKSDDELKQYSLCSEILSDLCIEEFTKKRLDIDKNDKIN